MEKFTDSILYRMLIGSLVFMVALGLFGAFIKTAKADDVKQCCKRTTFGKGSLTCRYIEEYQSCKYDEFEPED